MRIVTPLVALLAIASAAVLTLQPAQAEALPPTLAETGWPAPAMLAYSPQYPLWSDGAAKQRWIALPPGRAIDASDPDHFAFPRGTRLWKQFSQGGRRVETRYIALGHDGRWSYATYRWNAAGTEATLVPAQGERDLPSRNDCLACHESAASPVLGFNALQLSPDRDPLAPHASTAAGDQSLADLVQRGKLRRLPLALLQTPPRVASNSATERAALGYLHGNCGHCHNASAAAVPLTLQLAQSAAAPEAVREQVLKSSVGAIARMRLPGSAEAWQRIAPGRPEASLLLLRMRSRHAALQMPPLGTTTTDDEGLALVERWITEDLQPTTPESTP
jgi:hypothetical protein